MDGREIPGFYFDTEKKKYFKIQTPRHAPAPDSKYTIDNIRKERKRQKIRHDVELKEKKLQKETIVRRFLNDPIMHASLDREMGLRKTSYYMHTAWPDACISPVSNRPHVVVDRPKPSIVRLFDRDPKTKTLYAVHADNQIKRRRINTPDNVPLPPPDREPEQAFHTATPSEYSFEPWDELHRLTSPISSLQYLPTTGTLVATAYGADRPPVVHFSNPDPDGPYVAQQFTPTGTTSIWTSRAPPVSFSAPPSTMSSSSVAASDTEAVAVGTSNSLLVFKRLPCGQWNVTTPFESKADVLTLDWLAPTTIAMGCRNGKIHLYDTRSQGSSTILRHPFPITSLRRADDETRLVCAGLEDSLYLYDIRSSRRSKSSVNSGNDHHYNKKYFEYMYPDRRSRKKRRTMQHVASRDWSQPVLTFEHSNKDGSALAIDVHPQMGLVAAAQDNAPETPAVRIHNLWTGKLAKEIERTGPMQNPEKLYQNQIQCLKFMDFEEGVELWSTWSGSIVKFK
ncbi:hypothetical protein DM02DRAFT_185628 [Periconia macrospinosa]|uniref:WD40 repeat-like protein n=1 Tax=Periconia macrospinosa TaxID=97972 RepID=A0A2V1DAK6_9PLEO|nr:hypothetical protein DM02DRAFT_185628 [Periconia macrospinosa]